MTTRSHTPEPPYCWQNKDARRAIREHMNGHESTSAALSLYDALTEIASNEKVETFKAGQPYIGTLAGLSARTVRRIEPILEQVGVVAIERPRMRGHHTYTLLAQGQGVLSKGQDVPTLGQDRNPASCPPVEEQRTNKEEQMKCATRKRFDASSQTLPFDSSEFESAWRDWCEHRRETRRPLTPKATEAQLKLLTGWGEKRAVAALVHSIAGGYSGIFEPNSKTPRTEAERDFQRTGLPRVECKRFNPDEHDEPVKPRLKRKTLCDM